MMKSHLEVSLGALKVVQSVCMISFGANDIDWIIRGLMKTILDISVYARLS